MIFNCLIGSGDVTSAEAECADLSMCNTSIQFVLPSNFLGSSIVDILKYVSVGNIGH